MHAVTHGAFILLAALLLIVGLNDLFNQLAEAREIRWGVPLLLFGLGIGIPVVMLVPDLLADKRRDE